MIRHLFELLSANVPGGLWLWVGMVAIGSFVAWFVYKISEVVDRRKVRQWVAAVFVLSIFIYGLLWLKFPPSPPRTRLAIVPTQAFRLSPEAADSYALQERAFLAFSRWLPANRFIVTNPDWIYAVIPPKVAANPDSLPRFFRKLKTDQLLWMTWNEGAQTLILWPQNLHTKGFGKRIQVQGQTFGMALKKALPQFYRSKKPERQTERLKRIPFVFEEKNWLDFARARLLSFFSGDSLARQKMTALWKKAPQSPLANAGLAQIDLDIAFARRAVGAYTGDILPLVFPLVTQARKTAPGWAFPYLLAGKYFVSMEIWSKAQENLFKSLKLYPNNDELYVLLSRLHPSRLRKIGFFSPERALEKAVEVNPASVLGHLFLADALYRQHDLKGAEFVYKEILAINPDLRDVQLALAKFYIDVTNYSAARKILTKIVQEDSTNGEALYDLGMIAYLKGNPAEAKNLFLKAVGQGGYRNAYLYLAKLAEKKGNLDGAIEYLRRRIHLKLGPNDPFAEQARRHLQLLLRKKGVL